MKEGLCLPDAWERRFLIPQNSNDAPPMKVAFGIR